MDNSVFGVPSEERYFEDYIPGSVYTFGSLTVTQEEMIAFAKRYDPQVFHTDPDVARRTPFGALIASGWLTGALAMRLLVDHYLPHRASLGSPGIDEVRWIMPVPAGDEISVRVSVVRTKRSRSRADRGVVHGFIEVLNQNQEVVMTWKGMGIMLCRGKT